MIPAAPRVGDTVVILADPDERAGRVVSVDGSGFVDVVVPAGNLLRTAPEQVRVVKFASVPPIVCTKWCRYADGHPGEHHVDDQSCVSEERYVRPAVRATGGWKGFQTFVVHARRQSATSQADVVFWEQSADWEQRLTVAEARALAANLLAAADLAEASTAMVR